MLENIWDIAFRVFEKKNEFWDKINNVTLAKLSNIQDYTLPGGIISKLKTPKTDPVHTKNNHLWKGDFSKDRVSLCTETQNISQVVLQSWSDHIGRDKQNFLPTRERNWWWKCGVSSRRAFSSCSPSLFSGCLSMRTLQASYSNKSFLSLTMPLTEFLSELRHKECGAGALWSPGNDT